MMKDCLGRSGMNKVEEGWWESVAFIEESRRDRLGIFRVKLNAAVTSPSDSEEEQMVSEKCWASEVNETKALEHRNLRLNSLTGNEKWVRERVHLMEGYSSGVYGGSKDSSSHGLKQLKTFECDDDWL